MLDGVQAARSGGIMNENMKCPKCAGHMVQGFVPDYSPNLTLVSGWLKGQPQRSFWSRTKGSPRDSTPIGAFACEKCGFLELYADPRFAAR